MDLVDLNLCNNKKVTVQRGITFNDVIERYYEKKDIPIVMAKLNGKYYELSAKIPAEGKFEAVYINTNVGNRTYMRTLQFVLIKAVLDIFPKAKITIEHSLSKGIYGEIHKDEEITKTDISAIKTRMQQLIDEDLPIRKVTVSKEEAVDIFTQYNMQDKVRLLKHVTLSNVTLYQLGGRYDYFYGSMAFSTGVLKIFDVIYYNPGFLLRSPTEKNPLELPPLVEYKKLSKIFHETELWGNILDVGDVGSLNDKVVNGDINNFIRVAEALHEKKIAYIADMIEDRKDIKIVLIAGPSSSGKTTFSKRLGIQLRVNGIIPVPISLDDYFVDRDHTPKDENGEYDFESIYALDLQLFNEHLQKLMDGEEVELPVFNFKTGAREMSGEKLRLPNNGIIVVEGIHGLNELLTSSIDKKNKFKIYISALTQLNVDDHNRIATTDVRIIRRIVRDFLSRGYGGEDTLKMWPSIKRGEEKNIFVFQELADVMFNSNIVYELCVLKRFAIEELSKIKEDSTVYYEAQRLKSFLHFFKEVDTSLVPDNSILREFIGGSCFYKY